MLYMDAIAVLAFFWLPVGLISLLIYMIYEEFFKDTPDRRRRQRRRESERKDKLRKREHEARMAKNRARLNERRW